MKKNNNREEIVQKDKVFEIKFKNKKAQRLDFTNNIPLGRQNK